MRHLINILRKKHGTDEGAAQEFGLHVNAFCALDKELVDSDRIPADAMADAEILVDMLREYFEMVVPDQRVVIMNNLMDGYCPVCGSSATCQCYRLATLP